MQTFLTILGLFLLSFTINLPFGYLRQGYEKFTFGWYFYIHISIPFLIYLRVKAGFSWKYIPLTLCGAVAGQLVGGMIHRRRNSNG
jgi:hypothetical protein